MNYIDFFLIHLFFKRGTIHRHARHRDGRGREGGRKESEIGGELAAELARK